MRMFKKFIAVTITIVLSAIVLCSCGTSSEAVTVNVEDVEYYQKFKDMGISINVYNWGEYIANGEDGIIDVNKEFTALTGIKVNYSTYATNEELYAKLKAGAANYDVIIPSDYMISRMINEDMLEPVNLQNIPNFKYIREDFKQPIYDEGSKFSVPYTWGTVGIIYDKDATDIEESEIDWDVLWNEDYKEQVLMFDNPRDAFGIAEIMLGYSINTENPDELKKAAEKLKEQKPVVQAYVMDEIFDKMGAGEAVFAPYYAGDAVTLMSEYENLGFVVPKSGTNLFIDAMCIPKGAAQKEAAEMYINFMCEPEVACATAEFIGYSTPNTAAFELLPEEIKSDEVSYHSDEYIAENTTIYRNLSQEANQLMQDLWTEMKSSN